MLRFATGEDLSPNAETFRAGASSYEGSRRTLLRHTTSGLLRLSGGERGAGATTEGKGAPTSMIEIQLLRAWTAELDHLKAKVEKQLAETKAEYYEHIEELGMKSKRS